METINISKLLPEKINKHSGTIVKKIKDLAFETLENKIAYQYQNTIENLTLDELSELIELIELIENIKK